MSDDQHELAAVPQASEALQQPSHMAVLFDLGMFAQCEKIGELMANGRTTIPEHLVGNAGDCTAIAIQALQWRMNPWAVAQKTHLVGGKLGYEAQLVHAALNATGPLQDRLHYEWFGPWDQVIGKFKMKTSSKGNQYQVPDWTADDEAGCGVRVWATLHGEAEPRVLELLLSQATVRNSTLWASDPKQQLGYLASKRWARLYCPDVILGVYTPDECEEFGRPPMKNITPRPQAAAGLAALGDALAKREEAAEPKPELAEPDVCSPSAVCEALQADEGLVVDYLNSLPASQGYRCQTLADLSARKRRTLITYAEAGRKAMAAWADKAACADTEAQGGAGQEGLGSLLDETSPKTANGKEAITR